MDYPEITKIAEALGECETCDTPMPDMGAGPDIGADLGEPVDGDLPGADLGGEPAAGKSITIDRDLLAQILSMVKGAGHEGGESEEFEAAEEASKTPELPEPVVGESLKEEKEEDESEEEAEDPVDSAESEDEPAEDPVGAGDATEVTGGPEGEELPPWATEGDEVSASDVEEVVGEPVADVGAGDVMPELPGAESESVCPDCDKFVDQLVGLAADHGGNLTMADLQTVKELFATVGGEDAEHALSEVPGEEAAEEEAAEEALAPGGAGEIPEAPGSEEAGESEETETEEPAEPAEKSDTESEDEGDEEGEDEEGEDEEGDKEEDKEDKPPFEGKIRKVEEISEVMTGRAPGMVDTAYHGPGYGEDETVNVSLAPDDFADPEAIQVDELEMKDQVYVEFGRPGTPVSPEVAQEIERRWAEAGLEFAPVNIMPNGTGIIESVLAKEITAVVKETAGEDVVLKAAKSEDAVEFLGTDDSFKKVCEAVNANLKTIKEAKKGKKAKYGCMSKYSRTAPIHGGGKLFLKFFK